MEEEKKEEIFQTPPQFESNFGRRGNSPVRRVLIILISIIVIGLIIFGVMRFFGGETEVAELADQNPTPTIEEIPNTTPTPEDEEAPSPTEEPDVSPTVSAKDSSTGLDRGDLSIHILNGSGVTGAAKQASDYLEGLGYNVIQIGNAENSDYEETVIQIRSTKDDFLPLLEKDLSGEYTVGESSADLESTERADAIVIIGAE